jgi:hypothetical protein
MTRTIDHKFVLPVLITTILASKIVRPIQRDDTNA